MKNALLLQKKIGMFSLATPTSGKAHNLHLKMCTKVATKRGGGGETQTFHIDIPFYFLPVQLHL